MAASTSQDNQDQPILSHTFFKADVSIDVSDVEAGYEDKIPLFKSLNPLLDAPGRIDSFWGRIVEEPETILLANRKYSHSPISSTLRTKIYNTPQSGTPEKPFQTSNPRGPMRHTTLHSPPVVIRQQPHI